MNRFAFQILAVSIVLLSTTANAQQGAEIAGYIRDSTQALILEADVSVFNEQTGFLYRAQSGKSGLYEVPYLHPGIYKITVRKQGFRTLIRFGVKLEAGHAGRLDFEMEVGEMHEVVYVTDGAPLLDAQDVSTGTRIGREWIDRLPLSGRSFASLVAFSPGSVLTPATLGEAGQFSVNGQRPNTNYFAVDGISANLAVSGAGLPAQIAGGSLPTMTAFGSFHSMVPVEALNELDHRTATSPPELGRSPGGQIRLESRGGSNDWHGTLTASLRNEALDANDWFANRDGRGRSPLRMLDAAAAIGGPLRKERTFFFAAYERLRLRQPYTWRSTVPSMDSRRASFTSVEELLNAFPLPNGQDLGNGISEWTGSSSRPSDLNSGSIRLDHTVKDWLRLFNRYSDSVSAAEFGSSQINSVRLRARSLTFGVTTNHGPHNVNEFRINHSTTRAVSAWRAAPGTELLDCYINAIAFGPNAPCESYSRIAIGGIGQLLAGSPGMNRQNQWQIVDTATLARGPHQIRIGFDYRRLIPRRTARETSVTLSAASIEDARRARFSATIMSVDAPPSTLDTFAAYLQDSWRITPRLTLTGGVRWELHPPPSVPVPATSFVFPFSVNDNTDTMPAWSMTYTRLAPRAGVAVLLTRDGRMVLRSGFGRSFAPDFGAAVDGVNGSPYNLWQFNQGVPYQSEPPIAPPRLLIPGYSPDLRVPVVSQWTTTIERILTNNDVVSFGYVGSSSGTLLRRELARSSGAILQLVEATNHGRSSYHAFQSQYRRRMSAGLQVLASYTWAHSIDNGSADSALYWYRSLDSSKVGRGSSDFDVRHAATIASSYTLAQRRGIGSIWGGWMLDALLQLRTGFPIDVLSSENAFGIGFADFQRPDRINSAPLWSVDPNVPGARRLNADAFRVTSYPGSLGRNAIRGFGMTQLDIALHRAFPVTDLGSMELRAEVFNVLNHPNFADPIRFLDNPLFGQSASMLNLRLGSGAPGTGAAPSFQSGGPRSVQLMVRFRF